MVLNYEGSKQSDSADTHSSAGFLSTTKRGQVFHHTELLVTQLAYADYNILTLAGTCSLEDQ